MVCRSCCTPKPGLGSFHVAGLPSLRIWRCGSARLTFALGVGASHYESAPAQALHCRQIDSFVLSDSQSMSPGSFSVSHSGGQTIGNMIKIGYPTGYAHPKVLHEMLLRVFFFFARLLIEIALPTARRH